MKPLFSFVRNGFLVGTLFLAGCSGGGRTTDGRTVYAFAERDTITLSELFGTREVRRLRLQAPDSVPAAAEGSILRLAAGRMNDKGYNPAEVTDPASCIGCAMCGIMCPDSAITVEK